MKYQIEPLSETLYRKQAKPEEFYANNQFFEFKCEVKFEG